MALLRAVLAPGVERTHGPIRCLLSPLEAKPMRHVRFQDLVSCLALWIDEEIMNSWNQKKNHRQTSPDPVPAISDHQLPRAGSGPDSGSQGICLHLRPVSEAQLQACEAAAPAPAPPWSLSEPDGVRGTLENPNVSPWEVWKMQRLSPPNYQLAPISAFVPRKNDILGNQSIYS